MTKGTTSSQSGPSGALHAIEHEPPMLDSSRVEELLHESYGVEGVLSPLVSERDQNFRVSCADGREYVFKIASSAEDPLVTDFQIEALEYLRRQSCPVRVPVVHKTKSGELSFRVEVDSETHVVRLVSWLSGTPLGEVRINDAIAGELGSTVAELGLGLAGFEHPAADPVLLWDMRRAPDVASIVHFIEDDAERRRVASVFVDFEERVSFAALRQQTIHNDLNPGNVLLDPDAGLSVSGIIDFGDMLRAPLIVDVAIAASYLRQLDGDVVGLIVAFLSGYNRVECLLDQELDLLFDLVRTRLATTSSILWWRMSARDHSDPYRQRAFATESSAVRFLGALDNLGRDEFRERVFATRGC